MGVTRTGLSCPKVLSIACVKRSDIGFALLRNDGLSGPLAGAGLVGRGIGIPSSSVESLFASADSVCTSAGGASGGASAGGDGVAS